jgi:phytoene dehydrogenase-like protein
MTVDTDVFVIGAGPAGLTTAYCLTKETPSVIVIEKDPLYVGGISRTVRHGNFLFDIGGHRFFSKSKEAGDPARRFHHAAAAVAHLLWRKILFLSAERVPGAAQSRDIHQRRLHAVLCPGQGIPDRIAAHLP